MERSSTRAPGIRNDWIAEARLHAPVRPATTATQAPTAPRWAALTLAVLWVFMLVLVWRVLVG